MNYQTVDYKYYRVEIKNLKTNRIFDNYLIKIPSTDNIKEFENNIYKNFPNHILKATFTEDHF